MIKLFGIIFMSFLSRSVLASLPGDFPMQWTAAGKEASESIRIEVEKDVRAYCANPAHPCKVGEPKTFGFCVVPLVAEGGQDEGKTEMLLGVERAAALQALHPDLLENRGPGFGLCGDTSWGI